MGTPSMSDPDSELNPPPCRLMSTRERFSAGIESGVMMSVRTPAVVVSSTFTGYRLRASAESLARQASVRTRRSAKLSGPEVVPGSDASQAWASGLTVGGMGTTRVMWAVPSASKVAESFAGVELDCAKATEISDSAAMESRENFIRIVVPEVTGRLARMHRENSLRRACQARGPSLRKDDNVGGSDFVSPTDVILRRAEARPKDLALFRMTTSKAHRQRRHSSRSGSHPSVAIRPACTCRARSSFALS